MENWSVLRCSATGHSVWQCRASVISVLHEMNASANRGACMQICRRAYDVKDKESDIELEVDINTSCLLKI